MLEKPSRLNRLRNGLRAMRCIDIALRPDTAGINPAARWGDPYGI
jgi:hypothetical protein